jgi:hypothetical protein
MEPLSRISKNTEKFGFIFFAITNFHSRPTMVIHYYHTPTCSISGRLRKGEGEGGRDVPELRNRGGRPCRMTGVKISENSRNPIEVSQ